MNQEELKEFINFLKEKKIKGKDCAKWLGVSSVTFSKWITKKNPPSPLLRIVFEYLKFLDMMSADLKKRVK